MDAPPRATATSLPMAAPRPATVEAPTPEPRPSLHVSDDFREIRSVRTVEEAVAVAKALVEDPTLPTVAAWTRSGRKAAAFFPVYTPQELAHSLGMLPFTLHGAGESIEITHADAPLGSFLCAISKSTLEMALTHRLDGMGAFVFPYICDVSRNLEGIFSRLMPGRGTHMLHLPQNFESQAAQPFLVAEYRRLLAVLEKAAGRPYRSEDLRRSIEVYNRQRTLARRLTELRKREPWRLSLQEHHLVLRLGTLVPPEVHIEVLERVLADAARRDRKKRDAIRVVLVGPFCEQPTLDLLDLIEETGCYVVADELQARLLWHGDVDARGDPLSALAAAYVETPVDIGVRRTPTTKEEAILRRVREADAQGVLFLTAKFCEPAGEDMVLYRRALDKAGIPSLHLEFEERSSSYEQSRLALETFVESLLFD